MTDGTTKPIAKESRVLLPAEKNYSQIEKEVFGIIFAVAHFQNFFHGRHLTLQTDYNPFLIIFSSKNRLPTHIANILRRRGETWLNYNFKMVCQPSNIFGHGNGLSRLIPTYKDPLEDTVIVSLQSEDELKITLCNSVRELSVTLDQIKQEALRGEYIKRMKTPFLEKDQRTTDVFSTCDDLLLYRVPIVILSTLQKRILKDFHAGHPGNNWMKSLMRSFVYWTKILKTRPNHANGVPWLLRQLLSNSTPGQSQNFHGL